ncbi:MAG: ABC transporter permease subunit [Balneolaceae bacterium]|nr:ABC transporter permease subunit [Balneolaceae bacterium]MCH8548175.1 ABC transporter permease subunit [Balneolaceae bacterium]
MISKIIHLEWRNLTSNRWLQISFLLLGGLILLATLNRSYHHDKYLIKADEVRQTQSVEFQNFVADHDSVTAGLKEINNQRINPIFPFSLEVRLTPQAVFEPTGLAVLAVGQSDIHAGIFPVRTFSDPINKASVFYNPSTDLLGSFDFAFVLVFLIPLVVIAFSYNILSEERENGTLQMVMSQPVSLMRVLVLKLLFRFLILFAALLVILLLSMLLAGVSVTGNIAGIAILSVFTSLYLLFWFGVSLLVNLFGKSSSFNITALLGVWVFFVLVIPTLLHVMVENAYEVPPRSEALVEMRNAEEEAMSLDRDEILDRYFMDHPEFIEAAEGSSADEQWRELYEFYKWFYVVRQNIAEAVSPIVDDYYGRLAEQQEFAGRISAFSPAVVLKEAMNSLAGTSPAHYNHFHASTEQFRLEWMGTIRDKMLREQFVAIDDLDTLPQFSYSPADVNNGFARAGMALSFHLLAACGLIVLFRKRAGL